MESYIYVIFSATPYRMGRFIRSITSAKYNHVSIALDEQFTQMYSFSRRYYRTPLYGGFVKESLSRFYVKGKQTHIHVFKIPTTQEKRNAIAKRLKAMLAQKDKYLYNHLSVLLTPIKRQVKIPDAYVCVEFCVDILQQAGIDVRMDKYYSLSELEQVLSPYSAYTGLMPQTDEYDQNYYSKKPMRHPTLTTSASIAVLFKRLLADRKQRR